VDNGKAYWQRITVRKKKKGSNLGSINQLFKVFGKMDLDYKCEHEIQHCNIIK
jgi:hypothetical protein